MQYSVALIDLPLIYAVEDFNQKFIGYIIFHEYDKDSFELGWIFKKTDWGKGYANEITKAFIKRSSKMGKNLIIECDPNQEISKRIAMKNDFEFLGKRDGRSVFKRKLVNEILKGGGARNCKVTRECHINPNFC